MAENSQNARLSKPSLRSSWDFSRGNAEMPRSPAISLEKYTTFERTGLQAVAELLGTTVEVLIAAATQSGSTSSNEFGETDSPYGSEQTEADLHIDATTGLGPTSLADFSAPTLHQSISGPLEVSESRGTDQWGSNQTTSSNMTKQWDGGESFMSIQMDASHDATPNFPQNERLQQSFGSNFPFPFEFSTNVPLEEIDTYNSPHWAPLEASLPETATTTALNRSRDRNSRLEHNSTNHQDTMPHGTILQPCGPLQSESHFAQPFSANGAQTPKIRRSYTDANGGSVDSVKRRGAKRQRRGPYRDDTKRKETGLTRKVGACIPCSLQRIRCKPDRENPYGCCQTCIVKATTRRNYNYAPCWRYKISDAMLLGHADCPRSSWSSRWKTMELLDIQNWASPTIKTVTITQDVFDSRYPLKVKRFIPEKGDAIERRWKTNGVEQSFKCEPYAIADMAEAGQTLSQFADDSLEPSIRFYIGGTNNLLSQTYSMAYKYSSIAERKDEQELLRSALRLWCASRMESHSDRICGKENLGMRPQVYVPESTNNEKILLPPVLSAQMEIIVNVMILQPAQKDVLKRLKKLMEENKRHHWFAIYLCIFILLHSCALLTAADNKKARKQGLDPEKHRFFRPSVVEELHNGAKIILAWFHNWNKGSLPFSLDWESPDQVARSELNPGQCLFMKTTVEETRKMAAHFQMIQQEQNFEDEYFFLAQIYDSDWKPTHTT